MPVVVVFVIYLVFVSQSNPAEFRQVAVLGTVALTACWAFSHLYARHLWRQLEDEFGPDIVAKWREQQKRKR